MKVGFEREKSIKVAVVDHSYVCIKPLAGTRGLELLGLHLPPLFHAPLWITVRYHSWLVL